ncbi:L,D-transpeptidase family protein [Sediminibacterium ginsengisoli]|uniref:L,D-transpeptidase catalytic domain n=1 Tax=Sediminibacterium ginsengisoli TaxID=413434 RepID=A0A1T4LXB8_9BACT|nr:L,D-transpeptidase [Sediminibacterium ginsengisoli]SJZ59389.1 L,D-transpeptidase catalytic domain [Sediminibacterium ginsengisoli]
MKPMWQYCMLLTLCIPCTSFRKARNMDARYFSKDTYSILVIKSKYQLTLFDSTGEWIANYPVVFGNKDMGDKLMQGDRRTPEGVFHIVSKRRHEKWNRFMMLDYPTAESVKRFKERKAKGLIPANAEIGGGIGIHGTWPHEEYAIDRYDNWTEGCISTKNTYVEELFSILPVGTKVEIRR